MTVNNIIAVAHGKRQAKDCLRPGQPSEFFLREQLPQSRQLQRCPKVKGQAITKIFCAVTICRKCLFQHVAIQVCINGERERERERERDRIVDITGTCRISSTFVTGWSELTIFKPVLPHSDPESMPSLSQNVPDSQFR